MAILQVRDIEEGMYEMLRALARRNNRSISQEVIMILEMYLQNPAVIRYNAATEFLNLSWHDSRSAEQIIKQIESSRINSDRFGENNVLFD